MTIKSSLLLCVLLVLGWLVYAPGLQGGFLFDDFGNLPALGSGGPIDNWPTFWRYITSGIADPTGRPLTLLTFLIDAHDWPASPYPFKRTSLILHLFNGLLLALLLRRLGHLAFDKAPRDRIDMASILGAAFWWLHPLLVSTTLYIVQREAMLPATFTLLGLLSWLRGRQSILAGKTLGGLFWITLGLGGATVLAILSKANGALLPALALTIEYTLLRTSTTGWHGNQDKVVSPPSTQHRYSITLMLMGWLPALLIACYLLYRGGDGLLHGISATRPWTMGQRLLTEPRVLMNYLDLLWLPRPFTPGLFNDQIIASVSLWSPKSTLPALLAVITLIMAGCLLRHRLPTPALAILFYFVGQSLESSSVPLELYFEHRNYLPAMLMFWPLALWLCGVKSRPRLAVAIETTPEDSRVQIAKSGLAALIMLGLGLMTHARADLWGNTHDQALLWAKLNPKSPRAQANAAQVEMNAGNPARAVEELVPALAAAPEQVQLALNLLGAQCQLGHIPPSTLAASRRALHTASDSGTLLVSWFVRAMDQVNNPPCPELTFATIGSLLQAAEDNPNLTSIPGRQQDLYHLRGRLALMQGRADTALQDFNRALDFDVRTSAALEQAALLGAAGFPKQGLDHLNYFETHQKEQTSDHFGMPKIHLKVLEHQRYWPVELAHLRATLRDDLSRQENRTP